MAQQAKILDITRSYVPVDPDSFPESMHATNKEDSPEERIPVIPYDGYNFLPTSYGYKSFFGTTGKVNIDAITSRVDELFIIQTDVFENILVALAEDGIWTKVGTVDGAWTKAIALTIPTGGVHLDWSYCTISNTIYVYRQSEATYWKFNASTVWMPTAVTPNTLNMAGQMGIFKAGARLGFWDSANSVAWSNADDHSDFAVSLETLASATLFNEVRGRIITIKQEGDGFIIYATKSIVRVTRNMAGTFMWDAAVISNDVGVAYPREVTVGQSDTLHFCWTNTGLFKIENGKYEVIITAVTDFLKEPRDPIYLKLIQGRYLFLELLDEEFVLGGVTFSRETVPAVELSLNGSVKASKSLNGTYDSTINALNAINKNHDHVVAWNSTGGCDSTPGHCLGVDYPVFQDKIAYILTPTILNGYKTARQNFTLDSYWTWNAGGIAQIGGGTFFTIPANMPTPALVGANRIIEANTRDFFHKQMWQWKYERDYWDHAIEAIKKRAESTRIEVELPGVLPESYTETTTTFGPFISLSFDSERNNHWGWDNLNAWMHRSLVKTVTIEVTSCIKTVVTKQSDPAFNLGLGLIAYWDFTNGRWTSPGDDPVNWSDGNAGWWNFYPTIPYTTDQFANDSSVRLAMRQSFANGIMATLKGASIAGWNNPPQNGYNADSGVVKNGGITYGPGGPPPSPEVIVCGAFQGINSNNITWIVDKMRTQAGAWINATGNWPTYSNLAALMNDYANLKTKYLANCSDPVTVYKPAPDPNMVFDVTAPANSGLDLKTNEIGKSGQQAAVRYRAIGGAVRQIQTFKVEVKETEVPLCTYKETGYTRITSYIRYIAGGGSVASPTPPPPDVAPNPCNASEPKRTKPKINNNFYGPDPFTYSLPPVTIDSKSYTSLPLDPLTLPASSFLLQFGSIAPIYPTFTGTLVYDLQLKKWGKAKVQYKALLDYAPINTISDGIIPYEVFGVDAGCLKSDGFIYLFDEFPAESLIRWGKIGYFRKGFTDCEEVRVQFRKPSTGILSIEGSLDGKLPDPGRTAVKAFTSANEVTLEGNISSRWYNVVIEGQYDISYMEFRGNISGRR